MRFRNALWSAVLLPLFCVIGHMSAQSAIGQGMEDYLPGGQYDPSPPEWRGQSGFTFLQIGASARAEALGGAYGGATGDVGAIMYNPAAAASFSGTSVYANRTNWFAGMSLNNLGIITNMGPFSLAFAYHGIDYGTITRTVIVDADVDPAGYRVVGTLEPTASATGVVVAMQLTDRFRAGVQAKWTVQDFGSNSIWLTTGRRANQYIESANTNIVQTVLFDLGTQYDTGFRGIHLNMSLQHFGQSQQYVERYFETPLTYRVGFSFDAFEMVTGIRPENQRLSVFIDGIDRRDVAVDAAVGVEYSIEVPSIVSDQTLGVALRAGRRAARYQDAQFAFGGGLTIPVPALGQRLQFDYAYSDFGEDLTAQFFSFGLDLR